MPAGLLLIGLDAADWQLVDAWASAGLLPTLQRLRTEGSTSRLEAPLGLGDDAAWMSFATGVGPGRHGRFYHHRWEGSALVPHPRDAGFPAPFWERLADQGLTVAAIDVPKAPLGRVGAGLVVADWMPHGPDGPIVQWSPASAAPELRRHFPEPAPFRCDALHRTEAETRAYERQLIDRATLRCRAMTELLARRQWDVFLGVFAETHCAGHQCWHELDPNHPDHVPGAGRGSAGVIQRIYRTVDEHLATLVEAAGPDATIMVFALLGMGPNYSGTHLMPEILTRFEGRRRSPLAAAKRAVSWLKRHSRSLQGVMPTLLTKVGAAIEHRPLPGPLFSVVPMDLPTTLVRYHGRAPDGDGDTSTPEACLTLRQELLRLVDPATGRPLVRDVVMTREAFDGPHAAALADLIVVWTAEAPVRAAYSPRFGTIAIEPPDQRSGNHRAGGWLISSEPASEARPAGSDPIPVTDMATTIAAHLGV